MVFVVFLNKSDSRKKKDKNKLLVLGHERWKKLKRWLTLDLDLFKGLLFWLEQNRINLFLGE